MKSYGFYPDQLIAAGWEPTEVTIFCIPIPTLFWGLRWYEVTETRYQSPHSGKVHKLHKAWKKEVAKRQAENEEGYALGVGA